MKKRIMEKIFRNDEKVNFALVMGHKKIPKIPFHSDRETIHIRGLCIDRWIRNCERNIKRADNDNTYKRAD